MGVGSKRVSKKYTVIRLRISHDDDMISMQACRPPAKTTINDFTETGHCPRSNKKLQAVKSCMVKTAVILLPS